LSFDVHVLPSAEDDVALARDWYEEKAELGLDFVAEFEALLGRLRDLPKRFPEVREDVRRVLFMRFPYVLYFRLVDHRVDVLAVLHSRSGPSKVATRTS
jgi:plasmid stabilization system protein ParE